MERYRDRTVIWLTEERVFGYLVSLGAFVSRVQFVDLFGNECDEMVENDEFEEIEEPFTYERE